MADRKRSFGTFGLLLLATALSVPIILVPSEWAGWIALYLTYVALVASSSVRRNPSCLAIGLLALIPHHAMAIAWAFFEFWGGDAEMFHAGAVARATGEQPWTLTVGADVYTDLLGALYYVLGPSRLLAAETSILGFVLVFDCALWLAPRLAIARPQWLAYLLGLTPAAIIFQSIPLREAWQMLFVLLMVKHSILLKELKRPRHLVVIILAAAGLAIQHRGLGVFAVSGTIICVYWSLGAGIRGRYSYRALSIPLAALLLAAAMAVPGYLGPVFEAMQTGSLDEYVYREMEVRQDHGHHARASYRLVLDTSSWVSLLGSVPLAFLLYMCAPLPWQVRSFGDMYCSIEGIVRIVLVLLALYDLSRLRGELRSRAGLCLVLFFMLEFLWAMGTTNWGTAMRHHLPAYPLLLLTGGRRFFEGLPLRAPADALELTDASDRFTA